MIIDLNNGNKLEIIDKLTSRRSLISIDSLTKKLDLTNEEDLYTLTEKFLEEFIVQLFLENETITNKKEIKDFLNDIDKIDNNSYEKIINVIGNKIQEVGKEKEEVDETLKKKIEL